MYKKISFCSRLRRVLKTAEIELMIQRKKMTVGCCLCIFIVLKYNFILSLSCTFRLSLFFFRVHNITFSKPLLLIEGLEVFAAVNVCTYYSISGYGTV
jgi:hypothetical protein